MLKSYSQSPINKTINFPGFRVLSLWILFLTLILNSCSDDNPSQDSVPPVITDISVTSSESLIIWIDNNDLTQKLESALTFNYGIPLKVRLKKHKHLLRTHLKLT